MQRLHIHSITSIGAVEEGDNDGKSKIMFWKKLAPNGPRTRGVVPSPSPGAIGRTAIAKLDEQDRTLTKIRDEYMTISKDLSEVHQMTDRSHPAPLGTVREEVDRLASELVEKGEAPNLTAARPQVWRSRPDLVAKSRAPGEPSIHVAGGRKTGAGTVAEQITEIVGKRADEMSAFPQMWNAKPVERRVHVWKSREGKLLRALLTDSMKPGSSKLQKSGEHSEAFAILKAWVHDPTDGLR